MHQILSYVRSLLGFNEESRSKSHIKRDRIDNDYSSDEEPASKRFRDKYPTEMKQSEKWDKLLGNTNKKPGNVRYIPIQVDPGHPSTSTPASIRKGALKPPEVSWIEPKSVDLNRNSSNVGSNRSRRIFIECIDSDEEQKEENNSDNNENDSDDDVILVSKEPFPSSAKKYKFFLSKDPGLLRRVENSLAHRKKPTAVFPPIPKVRTNTGISKHYKKQTSIPKWMQVTKPVMTSQPLKRLNSLNGTARSALTEAFDLEEKKSYQELIRRATRAVAPKNVPASITTINLADEDDDDVQIIKSDLSWNNLDKSKTSRYFKKSALEKDLTSEEERIRSTEYDPITVSALSSPDIEEVSIPSPQSTSTSSSVKVERVNSLRDSMKGNAVLDGNWLNNLNEKYLEKHKRFRERLSQAQKESTAIERKHFEVQLSLVERKLRTQLSLPESLIEEPVEVVPELTDEQNLKVSKALGPGSPNQLLAEKFNLKIHRRDLMTLSGLNWLNDEVINFYMNLLMQRSEEKPDLPKVYAANTFFYPKLIQSGQAGLRRWTRKVDIFAHNLLVIPVHLGVHWCMCLVFMDQKEVHYLDSMNGRNEKCVKAMLDYLRDEHQDKKGSALNMTEWSGACLKDIPQQMNGSDCGVFACTFAEFASRKQKYSFTQHHMPLLRRKMALEILEGRLIT